MAKSDLSPELRGLYFPSAKEVALVDVPEMNFLMGDGQGNPNDGKEFQQAIEALYGVCYTMKFMHDKSNPVREARVMPLEALWWMKDSVQLDPERRKEWQWTAMIMQPEFVTRKAVEAAVQELRRKKNPQALPRLRYESFREGKSVQMMHIGPYAAETANIRRMHQFAEERGLRLRGKHHEIYLSDPSRAKPEKLKTVIRQSVE